MSELLRPQFSSMLPDDLRYLLDLPVRFSRLRQMDKAACHYAEGHWEETGPMRKGTALHAYLLGQSERICIYSDGARNERHGKYQAFLAANPGKHVLNPAEFEQVDGMRKSVLSHPMAAALLDGEQEQPIEWQFAGRRCLSTPDNVIVRPNVRLLSALKHQGIELSGGAKILVELKACHTTHPDRAMWHFRKMAYHAQLSFYQHAIERAPQYEPTGVGARFIVAVEDEPPYPVTIFRHDDLMLKAGTRLWRAWFEKLMCCEQQGRFPGYADGIVTWTDERRDEDPLDWEDGAAAE